MRSLRFFAVVFICLLFAAPTRGQREDQRQTLTEAQQEQIAEAGIDADGRIGLYTKFLDDRADTIKGLIKRAHSAARGSVVDKDLENFAALMDELGSNLDEYGDRKADIRKSLKKLSDAIPRWQGVLHELPSEPAFSISLTDAVDASNDLDSQTKQLMTSLDAYFKDHKDAKGQQWAEPQ